MAQRKNKIMTMSKKVLTVYVVMLFVTAWFGYYNAYAFRTGRAQGGIVSVIIYLIIYSYFARLYKAFKVGTYHIAEIIFSQFLAIGLADVILYVECCLIARRYVSLIPGLITAAFQLGGMVLWSVIAKQYFIGHIETGNTLVIFGSDEVDHFVKKIEKKYSHLFAIREAAASVTPIEELQKKICAYDTIMLYEVELGTRTTLMQYCIQEKKKLYMTPRIADILMGGFEDSTLIDSPLVRYEYNYCQPQTYWYKRLLDVFLSGFFLILMAIPMALVAFAIRLDDGGPVFFRQKRCTKDAKVFEILKFRSMVVDAEKDGAIPCRDGDSRITRVGRVIRRFRLDELPQLFNVLKGDMSLVGPRPERVENVKAYTEDLPEFAYRMRVRGGLTGYAQIYGKYNTSAYDKLKLDLMYIERQSFLLDMKLLLLTVKIIFVPESTEGFAEGEAADPGEIEKKRKKREYVIRG